MFENRLSWLNTDQESESDDDEWDWGEESFIRNQDSYWTGINPADTWEGVGRLIHETQILTETLIRSQARYLNLFKNKRQQYTLEQLESNSDIQELRKSTLGHLIMYLNANAEFEYEKDLRTLKNILTDRNYFVHQFFYETMRESYDIDDLNRDVRRLKIAINTVVKFNNRYEELVNEALYDADDC